MEQLKLDKRIYLDYAAATPIDSRVQRAMDGVGTLYANPNAQYAEARLARETYGLAKKRIGVVLNVRSSEIVMTSGATESDNLAILGSVRPFLQLGAEAVTLPTEHKSVLAPMEQLQSEGAKIRFAKVDRAGVVDLADLERTIGESTVLVSISYASSEFGTIQPMAKVATLIQKIRKNRVERGSTTPLLLHSDCSAAAGLLPLSPTRLSIDLMTLNPTKFFGPHATGILYVRSGIQLSPITYGGGQQNAIRPGTEDVVGAVGAALALELAEENRNKQVARLTDLRESMINGLRAVCPDIMVNGSTANRLANNVNISVPGKDGEDMVARFDALGVAVATGAACSASSEEPSHALLAIGLTKEQAQGSVRITTSRLTTKQDVDGFLKVARHALT